jgi:hypothetical protein
VSHNLLDYRGGELSGDGLPAGVESSASQRLAEPHDLVLRVNTDRPRIGIRTSRSQRERRLALGLETVHQRCTQTRDTP